MKRAIQQTIWIFLAAIATAAGAQNLVQNPGFESTDGWDSYWKLATDDPSSPGAMADPVTSGVYEGSRSVQLSNSVKLKWTYLHTDTLEAPITLRAGKKYEVKGWVKVLEMGKAIDLSIFWNGSSESVQICGDNPDPSVQPDWFEVKDTIYPTVHCTDAYLRLGFRSDKDGHFPAGRLLLDAFSVTRIPEITDTDITGFSLPGQSGEPEIDYVSGTVNLKVPAGTNVTSLTPVLVEMSEGASISPVPDAPADFSSTVVYTVTARDGTTTQDWGVEVEILPYTGTDILAFTLPGQTGTPQIDIETGQVTVTVPFGADITSLVPDITVSEGARIDPPEGSALDFSAPLLYEVTAEDGTARQWTILVNEEEPSSAAAVVSFELPGQLGTAQIDTESTTILVEMPVGTEVTSLAPKIDISEGATIDPGSDVDADFSAPVVYQVTAEDGVTSRRWTVTVTFALSQEADIVAFTMGGELRSAFSSLTSNNVTIDPDQLAVMVEVSFGTDVTSLVPNIEVSAGATVDPASGLANDFTTPVEYTVKAQDGMTSKVWTVTVEVLASTATDITGFTVEGQLAPASIDANAHTVSLEVSQGTDLTSLEPQVAVSPGAILTPSSGESIDFSSEVIYTVTAEDGSTQEWLVTILKEAALSADPQAGLEGVQLYPNPAKIYVIVETGPLSDIYIQDLHGKVVGRWTAVSGSVTIPVSHLARGIYLVTIRSGAQRQVKKLLLD